jgi:hypothetical protein
MLLPLFGKVCLFFIILLFVSFLLLKIVLYDQKFLFSMVRLILVAMVT